MTCRIIYRYLCKTSSKQNTTHAVHKPNPKNTNINTRCFKVIKSSCGMMHNLVLDENDTIQIESVSLPVGTFAKFQPLSPEFLDITNPKAVLENCLRTFACLTSGDVIAVQYNQRVYELCVLETQPGKAISIIECDMNVEFAAPVGYKETEVVKQPEEGMVVDPADLMPEPAGFVAFRGTGNRLDGKRRKDSGSVDGATPKPVYVRGIPDYDYQIGTLRFLRQTPKSEIDIKEENEEFKAFSGEGFSLRHRT
ncbi:hypothetical protein RI129_012802 [Pyrocoelia pectoralis]|uniref:Ubiquitin fusion degradation protein UFD1 N-terminal subdomain 2 domain-containing protein n=1 Tax=Pyrocoelia pectoralis TaxID=417401 RepID=A0AAN7ZCH1_9COLE